MRVTAITIENYKSHRSTGPLSLDPVTVFVGANNAGKSAILQALYGLQQTIDNDGVTRGETDGAVTLQLAEAGSAAVGHWPVLADSGDATLRIPLSVRSQSGYELQIDGTQHGVGPFPQSEPHHFVIPYLAKRKVAGFSEGVSLYEAQAIRGDLLHLPAKLSRLSNPSNPKYPEYAEACQKVLGYVVTSVPSGGGQRAGIYIDGQRTIYIEAMGEGVPQIAGLIAELVLATDKLFLIEELENDLHPRALKDLLDLLASRSAENQFVITTHSHIVTRHLGGVAGAKVYNVTVEPGVLPPVAQVEPVETTEARVRILRELGYELSDFDLWDAWLILEESSAERIIGSFLIPWFVPELQGRIRTVAAGGTGNVEPSVEDFRRLFLFTHLEEVYRQRAWVVVDGDDTGRSVVERLRELYGASWPADHFVALREPAFERYYPPRFSKDVEAALALTDRRRKQEAKKALLEQVLAWCRKEPEQARRELAESAGEVIEILKSVAAALPA